MSKHHLTEAERRARVDRLARRRATQTAWTWTAPRVVRGRRVDAPRLTGTVARSTLAGEQRAARQRAYFAKKEAELRATEAA